MKARWQEWSARFAAISQRERAMVAGAAVVAVVMGGDALWLSPQWDKARTLEKSIATQRGDAARLGAELASLATQAGDPDAANKAAQANMQQQMTESDHRLRNFGNILVPPEKVPHLLQTLLARHQGLEMMSLRTLAPTPLVERAPEVKADPNAPTPPPLPAGGQLYKHGIEIRIAGGYSDLLAYVTELEAAPQRLMWGQMHLTARYPRSELRLTLYTLSLDKIWLVV